MEEKWADTKYDELREQYVLFICPNDVFGKGLPVYSFQNREETDPKILMGDLCYKNFYIFKKYSEITDKATREYMQYFATQKHESEKMKRIHELVERYRKDPATKKAYMTLEQELNRSHARTNQRSVNKLAKPLGMILGLFYYDAVMKLCQAKAIHLNESSQHGAFFNERGFF